MLEQREGQLGEGGHRHDRDQDPQPGAVVLAQVLINEDANRCGDCETGDEQADPGEEAEGKCGPRSREPFAQRPGGRRGPSGGLEVLARLQGDRDAGEGPVELGPGDLASTDGGILQANATR